MGHLCIGMSAREWKRVNSEKHEKIWLRWRRITKRLHKRVLMTIWKVMKAMNFKQNKLNIIHDSLHVHLFYIKADFSFIIILRALSSFFIFNIAHLFNLVFKSF